MEGSHETVSSGGVQGSLKEVKLKDEFYSSNESISIHETVSSGGVKGRLGRGKAVMPPGEDHNNLTDDEDGDDGEAKYQKEDAVQKFKFDYVESSAMLEDFPEL